MKIVILTLLFCVINIAQALSFTQSQPDSLSYIELFQFKKETLIQERTLIRDNIVSDSNQRWQRRVLLATLSAAFLGFSVMSKNDSRDYLKKAAKNKCVISLLVIFFVIIFIADCSTEHLTNSVSKRGNKIRLILSDLQNISCDSLMKLVVFADIGKERSKEKKAKGFVLWWWEKLKAGLSSFQFIAFYIILLLMWVMGYLILYEKDYKDFWTCLRRLLSKVNKFFLKNG